MYFKEFAKYLQRLETTTKRLEITYILSELIKNLDVEETDKAIYLASGYLKAPFESQKLNIAEKMMIRILENTYFPKDATVNSNRINDLYKETGDLGNVAFELSKRASQDKKGSFPSITEIHQRMLDIAKLEGSGSQEQKIKKTSELLNILDSLSSKFVVRIILGVTRLGFTELTIIDALSDYLSGTKKFKEQIEQVYSIHPDIGLISKRIKEKGIPGINDINIETGVPILSQKPQRVGGGTNEAIKRMAGKVWAEFKFDGTRVQLHFDRKKSPKDTNSNQIDLIGRNDNNFLIKTYTRNLEETTHQYPDIVQAAIKQIKADSVILDCEAIGFDRESGDFLPFQETIQRKRKHNITNASENIPLKCFIFDILYLNGVSLIDLPLKERRSKLNEVILPGEVLIIDEHKEVSDIQGLNDYFETAVEKRLEGLIAKNPNDPYQAGARSYSWVKLKIADEKLIEDSIECVVLGYYYGKGIRAKFGIGGFLAGIYDDKEDVFKTITKVGTGLKDEDWVKLKEMADKIRTEKPAGNVRMDKIFLPDVNVSPKLVVELGADEISKSPTHTAGYALRFPRLLKFRPDKPAIESTTLAEIEQMFKAQKKS